ncbi:MAG TPA: hypothetical protein VGW33_08805 [Terriglobia bacterium]|nr:hypothetical protein [Terriglobia bacterium]
MSRRHIAIMVLAIVVTAALSALVAYRRAIGHRAAVSDVADAAGPSATATDDAQCVAIDQAAGHVGENRCISGRVLRVYASRGGNTFLDFCQDYRQCPFTSIIFAADRQKFGNLETLAGRDIEIRGKIELYQGRAEIVIHDAEQIKAP